LPDIPKTLDQVLASNRQLLVVETAERALGRFYSYVKDLSKSRYAGQLFDPMTVLYDSSSGHANWQAIGSARLRQSDGNLLLTGHSGKSAIFSADPLKNVDNPYMKILRVDVLPGSCIGLKAFAFKTSAPSPAIIAETTVGLAGDRDQAYFSFPPHTRAVAISPVFAKTAPGTAVIRRIIVGY